jgi:hypothetical protein
VRAVADDCSDAGQVVEAVMHELASGCDVVRTGRARMGGHWQPQDLDEERPLAADRSAAPTAGQVEGRPVAAALHGFARRPLPSRAAARVRGTFERSPRGGIARADPVRPSAAPLGPDRDLGRAVTLWKIAPLAAGPSDEQRGVDLPGDEGSGRSSAPPDPLTPVVSRPAGGSSMRICGRPRPAAT